jgi:hypothetical protein
MNLTRLFCEVDDFCKAFIPKWEKTQLDEGYKKRRRTRSLSPSEIITLIVFYHSSGYRTFKWFYIRHQPLSQAFPKLVSYNRFIELLPDILIPLTFFMKSRCATGNGFAIICGFHTTRPSRMTRKEVNLQQGGFMVSNCIS